MISGQPAVSHGNDAVILTLHLENLGDLAVEGGVGIISHMGILYYSNWVLANSVDSGTSKQILVNVIGQAPLGYGIALLWPLVREYGKLPVALMGFTAAAAGSLMAFLAGNDIKLVLVGLLIRSTGSLPTYTRMAFLA